jgi:hypothetical protein
MEGVVTIMEGVVTVTTLNHITFNQFMKKQSTFNQFTSNLPCTLNQFIRNRFIQSHIVVQVVPPVDNGAVGVALSLIARVQLLVPVTAMVTGESLPYSRNEVYQHFGWKITEEGGYLEGQYTNRFYKKKIPLNKGVTYHSGVNPRCL